MRKYLWCLLLVFLSLPLFLNSGNSFSSVHAESGTFILSILGEGKASIVGVKDDHKSDPHFRVYSEIDGYKVTTIESDAFVGCTNLSSVMLSKSLVSIQDDTLLSDDLFIYYTGSLEEFDALNFDTEATVYPYSFDEGFINLWTDNVTSTSVCDITESTYLLLNSYYSALGVSDRLVVDAYEFDLVGHYTIKQGMEELQNLYNVKPVSQNKDLSQNTTIIVVVVIAIIGMTSICVFYSFKESDLIS